MFKLYLKTLCLLFFFFTLASIQADAKVYKWVDENGTIHFSDKPYSGEAREVKVQGTGISITGNDIQSSQKKEKSASKDNLKTKEPSPKPDKAKEITEADYRISSNVGEMGADTIRIAGRLSSGPRCENLSVEASAASDTDLRATVKTTTRKVTSHGSATFEGYAKVSGSSDDFGSWKVTDVKVRCND